MCYTVVRARLNIFGELISILIFGGFSPHTYCTFIYYSKASTSAIFVHDYFRCIVWNTAVELMTMVTPMQLFGSVSQGNVGISLMLREICILSLYFFSFHAFDKHFYLFLTYLENRIKILIFSQNFLFKFYYNLSLAY